MEPSPWAVISKVCIHQDIPLLQRGLVIADTPGLNDQNLTIVENTKTSLRLAGTIVVFLPYQRIHQNPSLDEILKECVTSGKMHETVLVVTKIDEMQVYRVEEREDELDAADIQKLDRAESLLTVLKRQISDTKKEKVKARFANSSLFAELDGKLQDLEIEKSKAEAKLTQVNISIRCQKLEKTLCGKLREIDGSRTAPDLPVRFISNHVYQEHVDGFLAIAPPRLDLEWTGIPGLRQYLQTVPTRGKFENLKGLSNNVLPNSLSGLNGILTKSPLERKGELRKLIERAFKSHNKPLHRLTQYFKTALNEHVIEFIENEAPLWKGLTKSLTTEMGEMKTSTFRAACKRDGIWPKHPTYGNINWTDEIQQLYSSQLNQSVQKMNDISDEMRKDLGDCVGGGLDKLRENIEKSEHAQGQNLSDFLLQIEHIKIAALVRIGKKSGKFKDSINHIRHLSTLTTQRSYCSSLMRPVYDKAYLITGKTLAADRYENVNSCATATTKKTGASSGKAGGKSAQSKMTVGQHRVATLEAFLDGSDSEKSFFPQISNRIGNDMVDRLEEWRDECSSIIQQAKHELLHDFDRRFEDKNAVKEEPDNEDPEMKKKMLDAVEQARQIVRGPLMEKIKECEDYEQGGRV